MHTFTRVNSVSDVMVNTCAWSGRLWVQAVIKSNQRPIGICCLFAKYTALSSKSKYWVAQNQSG